MGDSLMTHWNATNTKIPMMAEPKIIVKFRKVNSKTEFLMTFQFVCFCLYVLFCAVCWKYEKN